MKRILMAAALAAFTTLSFSQSQTAGPADASGWATGVWGQDYAFIAPAP
jgi:hypothetical protein